MPWIMVYFVIVACFAISTNDFVISNDGEKPLSFKISPVGRDDRGFSRINDGSPENKAQSLTHCIVTRPVMGAIDITRCRLRKLSVIVPLVSM